MSNESEPTIVSYPKDEMMSHLENLETIVVGLDRLGSEYSGDLKRKQQAADHFLHNQSVFRKLASLRKFLQSKFSDEIVENGMDELEARLGSVDHYQVPTARELDEYISKRSPEGL